MKHIKPNVKDCFSPEIGLIKKLGICLFKYQLSPSEKISILNSSLSKMLGYKSEHELRVTSLKTLFKNPKDADGFIKNIKKNKTVKFHETQLKKKDGKELWVAITACMSRSKKDSNIEDVIEDISNTKSSRRNCILKNSFSETSWTICLMLSTLKIGKTNS